jgi:mono/diheme cytochrome c family protein
MRIMIALALLLIVAAAAVAGIVYGGLIDVAATASEPGPLRWLLETTRERSISRRAEGIRVPDLSREALAAAGASGFDDMCASCHGAPGHAPFVAAEDMSPPPPRLDRGEAAELAPAERFWVIKHGIRMTGMPAWGRTHSDEEIWSLVAFLGRLPGMDADTYRQLAASGGHHHHDQGVSARCGGDEHEHEGQAH